MPEVSVRLHPIRTGTLKSPPGWFVKGDGLLSRVEAPVVSFALEHPAAGLVLIDAGLHASPNFGRINSLAFAGMKRHGTVREALVARDLDPEAVALIVMTHMHVDHASGLSQFPGVEVLVCAREWRAAQEDGPRHGYHRPQFEGISPRLVDLAADGEPADGFEQTHDVFGDGSVRLAFTPGHTHGHCSVVVATATGPVLVAGDAIYTLENLRPGRVPMRMEDPTAYVRSIEQLNAWRALHPDAPLIPGHDEGAWSRLEASY